MYMTQAYTTDSSGEVELCFVKTHEDAQLPSSKNTDPLTGDSGYDVYSVEPYIIEPGGREIVEVGLQLAYITPGYWVAIETRSGMGFKHGIRCHRGIVDNGYRGSLAICIQNHGRQPYHIEKGDRIAQLVVYPLIVPNVDWAGNVQQTERGNKGFGSSGK
jgi:dUTP pyrophosphatase